MDDVKITDADREAAVSRDGAIRFLENAMRNWSNVRFGNDDLEDMRIALNEFATRHRQLGIDEGLEIAAGIAATWANDTLVGDEPTEFRRGALWACKHLPQAIRAKKGTGL